MRTHRQCRRRIRALLLISALSVLPGGVVQADSLYGYDALGRLIRVELDNGMSINYAYDPTGNLSVTHAAFAPGAPVIQSVSSGNQRVVVRFSPPESDGGASIDSYTATCVPEGGGSAISVTSTGSPIVLTGLTNGILYGCSVHATNDVGSGVESSALVRKAGMSNLVPLFFLLLD